MSVHDPAVNPYAKAHDRPAPERLGTLRLRTLLVAAAGLAALLGGSWLLAAPLGRVVAHLYALALGQGSLPPAHVPQAEDSFDVLLPHLAFIALLAAAVMGQSVGAFGRLTARWVMLLPLVVGMGVAFFAPPTTAWMQVVPSRLERDIMHGRFDAADQALRYSDRSAELQDYVKAQIALRSQDLTALRTHGNLVLRAADRYVYGLRTPTLVAQFEPRVVHALDVAVNGEPLSEVGLRVQSEGALQRGGGWLMTGLRLALGVLLLLALWPLLRLWNQMRRRVVRIQDELLPPDAPGRASGLGDGLTGRGLGRFLGGAGQGGRSRRLLRYAFWLAVFAVVMVQLRLQRVYVGEFHNDRAAPVAAILDTAGARAYRALARSPAPGCRRIKETSWPNSSPSTSSPRTRRHSTVITSTNTCRWPRRSRGCAVTRSRAGR